MLEDIRELPISDLISRDGRKVVAVLDNEFKDETDACRITVVLRDDDGEDDISCTHINGLVNELDANDEVQEDDGDIILPLDVPTKMKELEQRVAKLELAQRGKR